MQDMHTGHAMLQTVQCHWRGAVVGTAGGVWIDRCGDDKITVNVSKQARGLVELASVPGRVCFTANLVMAGRRRPVPISRCPVQLAYSCVSDARL
jgi:hypothetical protein